MKTREIILPEKCQHLSKEEMEKLDGGQKKSKNHVNEIYDFLTNLLKKK